MPSTAHSTFGCNGGSVKSNSFSSPRGVGHCRCLDCMYHGAEQLCAFKSSNIPELKDSQYLPFLHWTRSMQPTTGYIRGRSNTADVGRMSHM